MKKEIEKNKAYNVMVPGMDDGVDEVKYFTPVVLDDGDTIRMSEVLFKTPSGRMADARICYYPEGQKGMQYEITVSPATKRGKTYYGVRLERSRYATDKEAAEAYVEASRRWAKAGEALEKRYTDTVRGNLSYTDLAEFGIHTEPADGEDVVMLPSWEYPEFAWTVVVDMEAAIRTPEGNPVSVVLTHIRYDDELLDRHPIYSVQVCPITVDGKTCYRDHLGEAYGTLKEAEKAFFEKVGSWLCDDHKADLKEIVDFLTGGVCGVKGEFSA